MVLSVRSFILISQQRKSAHKSYFAPLQKGWEVKINHRTDYFFMKICCENASIPKLHLHKQIIYQTELGIKNIAAALPAPSDQFIPQN